MGFSVESSIPALTVFFQGLISFFSPCVLPLLPLYVSYFAGGTQEVDENGKAFYPKGKVLLNTVFFVIGISFTFFLLGFGFTSLGRFFSSNRTMFAKISGIIMIFFGLYQLGFFGRSMSIERERRLPINPTKLTSGPLASLILGFTFSFAWTPCVGTALGSVLLMAGSSETSIKAFLLIGVYTLGFILPFLAVGLFTGSVLDFFKKYRNVVSYTVKIGGVLLIFMGIMTVTGFMNGMTSYLSGLGNQNVQTQDQPSQNNEPKTQTDNSAQPDEDTQTYAALDFTLTDQFGNSHTLSDYKGKTVFLNFWATWCPPCRGEMPEIQELYEKYGLNEKDLIVLGVAAPNYGREGSIDDIKKFLSDNGYSFPVVMDESGEVFDAYSIYSLPTTFMIDTDGNIFGYAESALTGEMMESIVKQTMEGVKE